MFDFFYLEGPRFFLMFSHNMLQLNIPRFRAHLTILDWRLCKPNFQIED